MSESTPTCAENIKELIKFFGLPYQPCKTSEKGEPFIIVPEGHTLQSLEGFLESPLRIVSNRKLNDFGSFTAYIERFSLESSTVFASLHKGQIDFTCFIDYHEADAPNNCDHTVQFQPVMTPDFQAWFGVNGRPLSQTQLAQFLENNGHVITDMDGAELLEMVQSLEALDSTTVKSINRLDGGKVSFGYECDPTVKGVAKGNSKAFPTKISITVNPFHGLRPMDLEVRLRSKISDGNVFFTFEIVRLDNALQLLMEETVEKLKDIVTVYRVN